MTPEGAPRFRAAAVQTYAATVGVAALGLVNVLITSRALGPAGRGSIAFLTTIAMITSQLSSLGVEEASANIAAAQPERRPAVAGNALVFALVLGVLAAVVVGGAAVLFPAVTAGAEGWLLAVALASAPMLILQVYLLFMIRADYGFRFTNAVVVIGPLVNVTVNGGLYALGAISVASAVITWIGGQVLVTAAMAWFVARRLAGFGRPDRRLARAMAGFGVKAHIGRVMKSGNYRFDQWLVGAMAGTRELGLYSVAVAWAEGLFFLPEALTAVLRPDIVRSSSADAGQRTATAFRLAVLLTLPMVAALVVLAPVLCIGAFGHAFAGSVPQLRVLAPGAFGMVGLKMLGNALVARGRPMLSNVAVGAAFIVTIALDVALIPGHGGTGAAIASTVAYTSGGIVAVVIFARTLALPLRALGPGAADLRRLVQRPRPSARA
jgi:O-antigen/teichoic acid export membrane protein